jgi:putative DNA primase/helicase
VKNKSADVENKILINLQNGTLEVSETECVLREHRAEDNLKYCLSFNYDAAATATMYTGFLNEMLPNTGMQQILHEFIGYTFTKKLKLEKSLFLYGNGCNGKSVIYDIVRGLLGKENVSSFSLSDTTKGKEYCRIRLKTKLLNYCSDDSGNMDVSTFKQLASGEPILAREIYGSPCEIDEYAKMMFNTNILPEQKDLDLTNGLYRRFIIIPFEKQVEKDNIDIHLAKKICDTELSGIFNLVLQGLMRILEKERFSECPAIEEFMKEHWDSINPAVRFINDKHYKRSIEPGPFLENMYDEFKKYCTSNSLYYPCNHSPSFARLLRNQGIIVRKVGSDPCRVFVEVEKVAPLNSQNDEHDEHDASFHC